MTPEEAFELVEKQLLDCPRNRLYIIDDDTGKALDILEIYESDWSLHIIIRNKGEE